MNPGLGSHYVNLVYCMGGWGGLLFTCTESGKWEDPPLPSKAPSRATLIRAVAE